MGLTEKEANEEGKRAIDKLINGIFESLTKQQKRSKYEDGSEEGPFFQMMIDEVEKLATKGIPALDQKLTTLPLILAVAPLGKIKKHRPDTYKRLIAATDSLMDTLVVAREALKEAMKE